MAPIERKERWWFPIGSRQQTAGHFGAKFGKERVDRRRPIGHILTRSGRDMGLSYSREIVPISFAV